MDRLKSRLELAGKALKSFELIAAIPKPNDEQRDAAIKRFEYTFETAWKAAQAYIIEKEGGEASSPKASIRASKAAGLMTDEEAELALTMADDRNLAAHTYNEKLAQELYPKLAGYARLARRWLDAIEAKQGE
jgi:nucleotidyltransferase substrate binding protein (TIGR01987 family)